MVPFILGAVAGYAVVKLVQAASSGSGGTLASLPQTLCEASKAVKQSVSDLIDEAKTEARKADKNAG
jgi:hypothetical protein